ncbi:MAG: radical SAM family heme chaperone HemW [Porphyromonadaceae bacterium]|nr:MAG: radical SAM family heme chaperone HemW [Porphyromonadaceae bacterium]
MSGIYIHIPFCKSKCYYCDFYSVTKSNGQEGFIKTLLGELIFRKDYLTNKQVDTIYFGGGTPTILSPGKLGVILKRLKELYEVDRGAEITIEANPDDIYREGLDQYREIGFNRISIGTQSFFDEHLKLMNRRHDAAQAIEAVRMADDCGFGNISLDLIYGIPGMTAIQWEQNLEIAAGLPADHISAYHLTIEPGTRFGRLKKAGVFSEIPDEQSAEQYRMLLAILGATGFEQYEISNFTREGRYSRHNTKYWMGDSYLGLGPSAHSFNGTQRHWNPASLTRYTDDINIRKPPRGETITPVMHRNEYVMTRLRTSRGIDAVDFKANFGESAWYELLFMAEKHLLKSHLILENGRIWFNKEAWFHSDGILSDLFLIR